jgi:site-specific DNA recombinase
MPNALIYCRVSTEEQAEQGYSLDAQEKFCRDFAQNNGYDIAGVFRDEGKSGTNLDRPALKDVLAKCQQDKSIRALIVQETDRLARNTKDHLTIKALLQKSGVKIISVAQPMLDDSPEGKMIDTILASVNQFQSDINSRKTRKGLQEKFDQGGWPSWAPLGYINVAASANADGKSINILKRDPKRWHILKLGFKLYLSGNYSIDEINDILYQKGLLSRNNKKLAHSVIVNILKSPFYTGLMRWGGQEKPGKHEPMISLSEHRRILEIVNTHNLHRCRRRKHAFLLRGFVICDVCGLRYTAEKHPIKKKDYYHCTDRKGHGNVGQYIDAKELEKQVEEEFKGIQFSKEFIGLLRKKLTILHRAQKEEISIQLQILNNKKKALELKRDKAEEKLLKGIILDEDFVRLRNRFREELKNIQNELCQIEGQREYDIDIIQDVLTLARNIYRGYKTAPYELKRQYLGLFWERFHVQNKKIIKAIPTKLIEILLKNKKVIIDPKKGPSSPDIITLLKDIEYLNSLKEKLGLIKNCKEIKRPNFVLG